MARKSAEAGPVMQPPKPKQTPAQARRARVGWCKFVAKGRCYVEGALLEASEQEITLSPAASYRSRNNRNLDLVDGQIPEMPEDAPKIPEFPPARPGRKATKEEREAYAAYETAVAYEKDFIDGLEDGDPKVGEAPVDLRLIKQG